MKISIGSLLFAGLVLAMPPLAAAGKFPAPVYVTMKGSGTVEAFPAARSWPGGPNMLYDALTPDGRTLLATSPSEGKVYLFDTASGRITARIAVGKAPKGVKVTPDGRFAYVSNQGSANISVIDLKQRRLVDNIAVESEPHNVRFTTRGDRAYVTLQGGAGLGVIDTATRKEIRVIPLPGLNGPHNLDLSPDERTAYVRDFVRRVAVVDLVQGKVRKLIEVGAGHGGIDVAPDGRAVATASIASDFVSIIDPRTLKVRSIQVGPAPHGIRFSRDGHWLYVTVTGANQVVVIDTGTWRVARRIAVGRFPFWVAVPGNP